jgi:DNA-binding transcriptional LysR family regulator
VRLGAFASAALSVVPRALACLRQIHLDVHLKRAQLDIDMSYVQILRGAIDLALAFDYDRAPGRPPARIRRSLAVRDSVLVVLPMTHRLANYDQIKLAELPNDPSIRSPVIERPLDLLVELSHTLRFQQRLEFEGDDFQTVLGPVDPGRGIALLPKLATLRGPPGVVSKPIVGDPLARFIYTPRHSTCEASTSLTAFERALAGTLPSTLATEE